ncbi:Fe(3+) ABC transporter substrate-binding protein [Synechocystis sp. FACHB-383]|uniref:Fe(3+) ABC transporter substrate-binding protein n=1 Tax=Synechocystis sp. FACHB-383 TaxID=2692864 RepID=UPI0016858952|nr:Fe(3+) ABC transporter substrate-binding protein [Synechocystis sp. FACHB-383]MBD2653882.1 Fe(3+) ABC transporter substrate-binding protein [Synechocystis sp. FACHB-383]
MTTKISRRTFFVGGTALTALVVANLPRRASAQSRTINLYSSRHYNTDDALYDAFGEVNLIEASAEELIERIQSEGANSPGDILFTVDAGMLWRAEQAGLFQPVRSAKLNERIPENLRHPDGLWYGFTQRARVLYYSRDRVNPADLSTYEALADPQWRGKILVRPSSNIYNLSLTASRIAIHGEPETRRWLQGLVDNFARQPEGNDTAQIRAIAAGIGDVAIANSYYYIRLQKSTDPADQEVVEKVSLFFPNTGPGERGTHVNVSGAGVLKNAPNRDAAIAFLEYLASDDAQRYFAEGNNEYPVISGVPVDPVLAAHGQLKGDPLNVSNLGRYQPDSARLMNEVGWQ